jgi:hypothetical protein
MRCWIRRDGLGLFLDTVFGLDLSPDMVCVLCLFRDRDSVLLPSVAVGSSVVEMATGMEAFGGSTLVLAVVARSKDWFVGHSNWYFDWCSGFDAVFCWEPSLLRSFRASFQIRLVCLFLSSVLFHPLPKIFSRFCRDVLCRLFLSLLNAFVNERRHDGMSHGGLFCE